MSASKLRRAEIIEKLFMTGRTYDECKRIYEEAKKLKSRIGRAVVRIDGKDYEV